MLGVYSYSDVISQAVSGWGTFRLCNGATHLPAAKKGLRPLYALLLGLGVVTAAGRSRAGFDTPDSLTASEQHRLQNGELVERRMTREHGGMRLIGGSAYQVIDAAPEVVWRAVLDTPYYPRTLPQVTEARVVEDKGRRRTVYLRHGIGLSQTSYYLAVQLDHARREMSFRLDDTRPSSIRAAWGFYAVRPYAGGRTMLAYGVMADLGDGLGRLLLRGTIHEWMMKVPYMVKRFVEGSGRYIYRNVAKAAPTPAPAPPVSAARSTADRAPRR